MTSCRWLEERSSQQPWKHPRIRLPIWRNICPRLQGEEHQLEAIIKKHGDIAETCVFLDATLRTSLLDVVCEIVGRIETNIISQMEEIESQLSAAEAAKINVSWLRASLNAINKRNETGKKVTSVREMENNHQIG
ncbi:phospholipase-like protein [Tanacetum coccineum]